MDKKDGKMAQKDGESFPNIINLKDRNAIPKTEANTTNYNKKYDAMLGYVPSLKVRLRKTSDKFQSQNKFLMK